MKTLNYNELTALLQTTTNAFTFVLELMHALGNTVNQQEYNELSNSLKAHCENNKLECACLF